MSISILYEAWESGGMELESLWSASYEKDNELVKKLHLASRVSLKSGILNPN